MKGKKSHRLANLAINCAISNGSNKVAIELRVVQFWSEIILVISNRTSAHAYDFRPKCTPLSSITIINLLTYHECFSFICYASHYIYSIVVCRLTLLVVTDMVHAALYCR